MALFDDLTKKAAKFTEKTIEKSSELVDTAKTKVSIKSAEADLDDQFIELGKLYYEVLNKDNVFDEKAAPVVQKIDEINQRIENLKSSLEKNNAITVHIYYTGENGSAKAFVKEMLTSGLVDEIKKEKGNRRYEYFFSVEDEETVLLVDSWDNQEAINLHHSSSIMDQIMELRIKYHLHMKVERYFLDETGIPKEDQKFIQK